MFSVFQNKSPSTVFVNCFCSGTPYLDFRKMCIHGSDVLNSMSVSKSLINFFRSKFRFVLMM